MISLRTKAFDLPLKHVFTISRGSTKVQRTFVVEASCDGCYGYGEATENDYYGASVQSMSEAIKEVQGLVEQGDPRSPEPLLAAVAEKIGGRDHHGASFALCALDLALHDLWGKLKGESLRSLWGIAPEGGPQSNFTIGIDTIPVMVEKLLEEPKWPVYKIKLGSAEDIAIVRELRKHTTAGFRVDANCGWTAEQAIEMSGELEQLGVEFIEQPLAADDHNGMREVYEKSKLPLFADEGCVGEADVDRCAGLFHGINIKLVKCGGLAPARRMIARARELSMQVMMGCMTESTVGISAIAQVLPLLDYVDMDGAALLASDIATGAKVVDGHCELPGGPGAGVELRDGTLLAT